MISDIRTVRPSASTCTRRSSLRNSRAASSSRAASPAASNGSRGSRGHDLDMQLSAKCTRGSPSRRMTLFSKSYRFMYRPPIRYFWSTKKPSRSAGTVPDSSTLYMARALYALT